MATIGSIRRSDIVKALTKAGWEGVRHKGTTSVWQAPSGRKFTLQRLDGDHRAIRNSLTEIRRFGCEGEAVWHHLGLSVESVQRDDRREELEAEQAEQPQQEDPVTTPAPVTDPPFELIKEGGFHLAQVFALYALYAHGDFQNDRGFVTADMVEWIETRLGHSWGSNGPLSTGLTLLDRRGFITRAMTGRRVYAVALTDRGMEMIAKLEADRDLVWMGAEQSANAFDVLVTPKTEQAATIEPPKIAPVTPLRPQPEPEIVHPAGAAIMDELGALREAVNGMAGAIADVIRTHSTQTNQVLAEMQSLVQLTLAEKINASVNAAWVDPRFSAVETILRTADTSHMDARPSLIDAAIAVLGTMR